MTPLETILAKYRASSKTEREKGSYFEELIRTYFRYEASYADLYSDVWLYADWAKEIGTPEFGLSGKDTGIDLVAKTHGTEEYHATKRRPVRPSNERCKPVQPWFLFARQFVQAPSLTRFSTNLIKQPPHPAIC